MIVVYNEGHDYEYELFTLLKAFFPTEEIVFHDEKKEALFIIRSTWDGVDYFNTEVFQQDQLVGKNQTHKNFDQNMTEHQKRKQAKKCLKHSLYDALKQASKIELPYGILTGIRPTKIVHEYLESGSTEEEIRQHLKEEYFISDKKIELLLEVSKSELKIIKNNHDKLISIYVGIPFCRTRCVYCSFTANILSRYKNRTDEYVDALIKEIQYVGRMAKEQNYEIDCIYIGGGTPTSLTAEQLDRLLKELEKHFDTKKVREYTVEAGRPDTITVEKLQVMRKYPITRISINPQSMVEHTLKKVGRSHSAKEIIECYKQARQLGFNNINMDLIAGLPDETLEDVQYSVQEVLKLQPENITVHTLAIKSSSILKHEIEDYEFSHTQELEKMVEYTLETLKKEGYQPYYMYRQKNMIGNLENVGYCKPTYEGVYNVQIMEEKQTIIAIGAGAVSKVVYLNENRLERIFNVKSVEEYLSRIDEMIDRKRKFFG